MSISAQAIRDEIIETVGDKSSLIITDAQIIRWINACSYRLRREVNRPTVQFFDACVPSQWFVDMASTFQNLINIRSIRVADPTGNDLLGNIELLSQEEFTRNFGLLWTDTGLPQKATLVFQEDDASDYKLYLYPSPDVAYTLIVDYTLLEPIATLGDDLQAQKDWISAYTYFCLERAYRQLEEWTAMREMHKLFEEELVLIHQGRSEDDKPGSFKTINETDDWIYPEQSGRTRW